MKNVHSSQAFNFSTGKNKFDNTPVQQSVAGFDEFESAILSNRSHRKGETYFCGPLNMGPHDRPQDYPDPAHYRLASHALPRKFIAFDHDGFISPEIYLQIFSEYADIRGFGYETWSHTEDNPRARAVFELSREVNRAEGISLGKAFGQVLQNAYGEGATNLDKCVYQNEQPIYSPGINAKIFHFNGKVLNVDEILEKYPEVKINPPAIVQNFNQIPQAGNTIYSKLTMESLEKVLGLVDCTDEPTWRDTSTVLARVYGQSGRDIFIRFSQGEFWGTPYPDFDIDETHSKFDRALGELASRPNGYGISHLLSLSGLQYCDVEFETNLPISFDLNMLGESMPVLVPPSFKYYDKTGKKPLQVSDNLETVLKLNGITVRYDQIGKRCDVLIPHMTCVSDESSNTSLTLVTDLAIKSGMTSHRIPELIDALASRNPFCPVSTYIDSRPWDGIDHFSQFTDQIKCSDPAFSQILWRKWFIQAVAAVFEPNGISNAGVIVLQGDQNIGKTRLFSDLASGVPGVFLEGQTLNPADKDSVMSAVGHWIVELGELDATFRKADLAQLKAFITKKIDVLRRPYARKDSEFPRRTVFAGTVNDFQFLHDPTGNRRFWPIDIQSFSRDETIDYQQLWAQAKSWYATGERWYLSGTDLNLLNQHSEVFIVNDPDVELLLEKYSFAGCTRWSQELMKDICRHIGIEHPSKSQTMRLSEAIRRFNGGQKPRSSNGLKYHFVPDLTNYVSDSKALSLGTNSNQGSALPVAPVAPVAPNSKHILDKWIDRGRGA